MKSMFGPAVKSKGRMWGWLSTFSHRLLSALLKEAPRWYTTLSATRTGVWMPSKTTSLTVPCPPCTDLLFALQTRGHGAQVGRASKRASQEEMILLVTGMAQGSRAVRAATHFLCILRSHG